MDSKKVSNRKESDSRSGSISATVAVESVDRVKFCVMDASSVLYQRRVSSYKSIRVVGSVVSVLKVFLGSA